MKFVHSIDRDQGVADMVARIVTALNANKPVLWLLSGGSNVSVASDALKAIQAKVSPQSLELLTVGQVDERYGAVGHADSNWKALRDAGFDFSSIRKSLPILIGKSFNETVSAYSRMVEASVEAVNMAGGTIVALLGIGSDGHIAGILPHSKAVSSDESVCGYGGGKFTRITLTPTALKRADTAYVFAFGSSKKEALENLRDKELPIDGQPAQLLKGLKEAFVYSDQV